MDQEFTDVALPGWEVVRKLGEGSFGGVYEIQRILPGGYVEKAALKKLVVPKDQEEIEELRSQSFSDESITAHYNSQLEGLVKEYQMMQSLNGCPSIVNCYDLEYIQHKDGIGWDIYIRMELLQPLRKVLGETYQEETVLKLGLDLCSALVACHGKNIIHRDIKPGNILVSENGTFKLGDFGIAKISEKTGTTGYMAPEVAKNLHYGFSADIYSLGLVMYWMMNDRTLPFLPLGGKIPSFVERETAIHRRCSGEALPEPVNGSRELKRIVLKACAYDPNDRYESAEQLAEELRQCGLHSETKKAPAPIPQPAPEPEETEEETQVLTRQPKPAVPQQEKKPEKAPEQKPPAAGSDGPAIGIGETYVGKQETNVPAEPVNPPKKEKPWKTLGIAVAAALVLTAGIFGVRKMNAPGIAFTYERNDTGIAITGYEEEFPVEVEIPSRIDGLPVSSIGDGAFKECTSLSSVTIPDGVTSIGECAFWGCKSLSSITIPDGVTSIGVGVFSGCANLSSITIPDSVISIGQSAFYKCTNLSSVTIPDSVTRIGYYAFYGCTNLESITIGPNCVIGANALPDTCIVQVCYAYTYEKNATGITITGCEEELPAEVHIPSVIDGFPVTGIGYQAFYGCTNLSSVIIPDGVTSIGESAFENCTRLHSLQMPATVTSIGNQAFYGCEILADLIIPEGVVSIGDRAFYRCMNLKSISFPKSVTRIGYGALDKCTGLSSVTFSRDCDARTHAFPEGCQVNYY